MLKITLAFLLVPLTLTACDNQSTQPEKSAASKPVMSAVNNTITTSAVTSVQSSPKLTTDNKIQIDWTKIDSTEPAVDKNIFKYSIAIDSAPVKNYMNAYHVDAKTAQYNLTVGMAVNEALSKILDQINTSYVSHELTAGNGSKLIIHTTQKVLGTEHNYVIEDPFAKGLILPIQIIPDGKK